MVTLIILAAQIIFLEMAAAAQEPDAPLRASAPVLPDWFKAETASFTGDTLCFGWNLGNSLDSHGLQSKTRDPRTFETYWGNPIVSEELIRKVRAAGFRTIRIPVTWYEHMDKRNKVDKAWMDRVQQVVDYCINSGFYVILNVHHDPWYTPENRNMNTALATMRALWTQIAERFADYDRHLLFEGMNEPRLIGTGYEWSKGTPAARENINRLNDCFVETVRQAGGYNPRRYLLIPTYCARTETEALEDFRLPKSSRLIVSVHLYEPHEFALEKDGPVKWDPGNPQDTARIDRAMKDIDRLFTQKGIPVVISEFGAKYKDNDKARNGWISYVLRQAKKQGIPCIWWDDGGREGRDLSFSLLDRYGLHWRFSEILSIFTETRFVGDSLRFGLNLENPLAVIQNDPAAAMQFIGQLKGAGARTIRIPLDAARLDRTRQAADYYLNNGFYVILVNRDGAATPWKQVAEYFAAYDRHLIFEGDAGTREDMNRLNASFVEAVRSSSGNSPQRYLLLPAYTAGSAPQARDTGIPEDFLLPKSSRLIVSVHVYERDGAPQIDRAMETIEHLFTQKNIPVVISEFGTANTDNNNDKARGAWVSYLLRQAKKQGIACLWRDIPSDGE
ncbi:hypothetical protein AGMMS49546_06490 [Spirochaetia bacterium]|nr:hypothetical protein AGMMS49546_06490 [Spirochaetia bacterium]